MTSLATLPGEFIEVHVLATDNNEDALWSESAMEAARHEFLMRSIHGEITVQKKSEGFQTSEIAYLLVEF